MKRERTMKQADKNALATLLEQRKGSLNITQKDWLGNNPLMMSTYFGGFEAAARGHGQPGSERDSGKEFLILSVHSGPINIR